MNNIVIAFASSDDKVLTNDHSVTKIDNFQMVMTMQTTRCTDETIQTMEELCGTQK